MAVNMRNKGQSAAIFTLIIAILVSTALVVLLYMTNPGIFGNLAYLLTLIKAAPAVSPSQAIFTAYNCINTPCTPFGSSYSSDMWTLYYGGSTQTQALNSQISFTVYNGTYTLAAQAINLGRQLFLCPETSNSGVYYNYSVPSGNSYKIYFYPCQLETTTFTETGLPGGQEWNMTYDGMFELSTSNSLIFNVPIAKYAFSINKSNGYEPNPASGALQSGQTQSITFTPVITYIITTFYSGLSQYASYYSGNWTLIYDGVAGTNTSLAKPIHILMSNDQSQSYPVTAYINNYVCNAKASSVTTGSTYTFSNWNCRTLFSESGLPIDKNWNLTYNGVFNGSTKSTISINTSAGYYKFKYFIPQNIPTSNQQQIVNAPQNIEYTIFKNAVTTTSGTVSLTYTVTNQNTFVAIMIGTGWLGMSGVSLPSGCVTQQDTTGPDTYETAYIATCTQNPGTYTVSVSKGAYFSIAAYVFGPGQYTFSTNSATSTLSSVSTIVNSSYQLYLCDGGVGNVQDLGNVQFTISGTTVVSDSSYSAVSNQTSNVCSASTNAPDLAIAGIGISMQTTGTSASQNIEYYVPITITNSQGSATSSPFQQEVVVDSANYQSYEAPNLQNVEFLYSNGQVIPSWLESGASSSSTQTVYWLKLASSIPAGSSITIYMEFAPKTTNLFNGNTIGEAPQLSPTYGEYDDGANVFNYYQEFGGLSSLPNGWSEIPRSYVYFYPTYTEIAAGVNPAGWYGIYTSAVQSMTSFPSIIEWYGNEYDDATGVICYSLHNCQAAVAGTSIGLTTNALGVDSAYTLSEGYSPYDSYLVYLGNNNNEFYDSTNYQDTNMYKIYGLDIANQYSASVYTNYSLQYSASNLAYTSPSYFLVGVNANRILHCTTINNKRYCGYAGVSSITYISWIRARSYPPNGVMPSVSFGGVQTPQQTVSTPPCYYSTSSTATNNETEAGSSANIIYYQEYCPVLFYQNTLPQGTDWSVTMNGNTKTWTPAIGSSGAVENLTFYAINNTVASFAVPTVSTSNCKYTPTPSSGSINVGKQFLQEISYTSSCQMTYTIFKNTVTTGGTASLTYTVTNQNTFVAIMIGAGWYRMSGIVSLPPGCVTQQDTTGPDTYETAYIATCTQNPGTYTVSVSGDLQTYFSMAAYVFSPGQYTFSTNSATSTLSSVSTAINSGYSLYLCDGGSGDGQFTISGTTIVNDEYSAVSNQTSNVCSASTNGPDLAIAGIGISMQTTGTSTPPNIEYYIPITITNSQGSATSSPFQQEVVVDSANYQNYEAPNLQNVEFLYSNGQVIPSWLESGASSSSTQTIYWLKLTNPIPAGGSITVYMGLASTNTNLFNVNTVGEAPQLSPIYGEYDDGAKIFNNYWNFAGTSCPSDWTCSGDVTINNGLGLDAANIMSSNKFSPQVFDVDVISTPSGEKVEGADYYGDQSNYAFNNNQPFWGHGNVGSYYNGGDTVNTGPPSYTGQFIQSLGWYGSTLYWWSNYTSEYTEGTSLPFSSQYYLSVNTNIAGITAYIQWVRTRAFPPNGVMPSVNLGSIQTQI